MDELISVCLFGNEDQFFEYLKLWVEKDRVSLAMSNIAEVSKPVCDCGAPGFRSHICPYQDDVTRLKKCATAAPPVHLNAKTKFKQQHDDRKE